MIGKKPVLATLAVSVLGLFAACGGGGGGTTPVPPGQPAQSGGPAPNGVMGNTLCLNADGPGGDETYARIESVLGSDSIESPSDKVYTPVKPHVQERDSDGVVGPHFAILAIDPTDVNLDGKTLAQGGDRSRTEIKISPRTAVKPDDKHDAFKAHEGETYVYAWRFKIAADMAFSSAFTHIHQIKAHGGEFDDPALITVTISNGKLAVRHIGDRLSGSPPFDTLGTALLDGLAGQWIDVREVITYSNTQGSYQLTMLNANGTERLKIAPRKLSLWRTGADHITPKWGIYRVHDAALNQNKEDYLYLANLAITRGSEPASTCR